jgi:hypothetical protein
MGMFDNVKCKYPLPEAGFVQDEVFQTKGFGDGFVGGFMDDYTITEEGELVLHKKEWEWVEEEDRLYYGTPEWDENPIFRMVGCMRGKPLGDEVVKHHGDILIYADVAGTWYEYKIRFTEGKVSKIERIYREFG